MKSLAELSEELKIENKEEHDRIAQERLE